MCNRVDISINVTNQQIAYQERILVAQADRENWLPLCSRDACNSLLDNIFAQAHLQPNNSPPTGCRRETEPYFVLFQIFIYLILENIVCALS